METNRMKCKTTVVIPNYNGWEHLQKCLKSLEAEKPHPFRVLVVDNGSADGSPVLTTEQFPWAEVVCFEENRGFSAAVNEGIRRVETDYMFLLNNDTMLEAGCIRALERRMESSKGLFSVQAMMVSMEEPGRIDDAGDLYCALGWAYAIGKGKPVQSIRRARSIFSACAGAALYRHSVFADIGDFDEKHFMYLEDVDLGYRSKIAGYRNCMEPSAMVRHAGSASSGSRYNPFKISHASRNSIYIIYKNMPFLQIFLNLPFLLAGFTVKFLFFCIKGYGGIYLKGLIHGMAMCLEKTSAKRRVRFKWSDLGNYIKIQLELWKNMLCR